MEIIGTMGAARPQAIEQNAYERSYPDRPLAAIPSRSAEDPLAASNGTLRFASERKPAAPRSTGSTQSRPAASRSASGTQKRSSSGGSGQPPKKKKRRRRKNQRFLFFVAVCVLVVAIAVLVTAIVLANGCSCRKNPADAPTESPSDQTGTETPVPITDDSVISGDVVLEGVSLKNLTIREGREQLRSALDRKKSTLDITVSYESYDPLTLDADTIGLDYTEEDVDEALRNAASGTQITATIPMRFDSEKLRSALYELNDRIPNHAINAQAEVKFKTNKIDNVKHSQPYWDFTPGQNGAKIDFDALERQVSDAIASDNYTASLTPSVTVSEPEITVDSLKAQLSLLGSYSTSYYFKGSTKTDPALVENRKGRDANITKAIGMMQVVELKPGKTFSFNKTTGDRTEKKGWAMANAVYMGSTYRKEAGGGVCQVSTTIFNAALRAGITDFNRRGHSIPSDYVTSKFEDGLGFDATVDSNHIDFSFKNTTGHTIYMFIYLTKNKDSSRKKNINVEIYGQKEEGVEYKVYNEILEQTPYDDASKYEYEYDKTMLTSAKPVLLNTPHNGYKVKTYVDKYKDGRFVRTVRTEETIYKPIYPIYRVGTAEVTPKPTNTPKPTKTPKPETTPKPDDNPPSDENP